MTLSQEEKKEKETIFCLEGVFGNGRQETREIFHQPGGVNRIWKNRPITIVGKNPEICAVPEPIWSWSCYQGVNVLELFYKAPTRYGCVSLNMVPASFITRKPLDERRIAVDERSMDCSLECSAIQLKQNGDLMEIEYGPLEEFARLLEPRMTPVDAVIYLRVDLEVALE